MAKTMTATMTGDRRPLRYGSRSTDGLRVASSIDVLQQRLAARSRIERNAAGTRRAAVLVPIVAAPAGLELLCFERTHEVSEHKGEICLPGGSIEKDDRDVVDAALREAHEELGIEPSSVRVLGLLDDVHTFVSNYIITPVAGFIDAKREVVSDPLEVARPIAVPLETLLTQGVERYELRGPDGTMRKIYSYQVGEDRIWGATARIIHGLLHLWFGEDSTST
jgi:8-oxo-dGTP pyrophosphatase MutT (NUDIX family)